MKRVFTALLLALSFGAALAADAPSPPALGHPALWRVTGKASTVYLFGSVHILSPGLAWRDKRVDDAIRAADTYVFETALDPGLVTRTIETKGSLPAGQSLRALLPPEAQKDLDEDLAILGIPEANIDSRRPWLVTIAMVGVKMSKDRKQPPTGVDLQITQEAQARGMPIRYLETPEQQLALIVPDDPKLELEAFEIFLHDFKNEALALDAMSNAWFTGDTGKLGTLILKEFDQHPIARKAMFDDRNKAWLKTLKDILDSDKGTFLVTVGAGHLLSDRGVPELLRRAGYKVEQL